jgi:hypothetical protein
LKKENIMKKITRIRLTVLAVILFAVVFAGSAMAADSASSVVRLSVVNNSQFPFYLYLYGGGYEYTLEVPAYTSDKEFVYPGEYSYYMEACNYSKFGTMDLSTFQTIHVPVCGGRAEGYKHASHHIDVATLVKPVRVTINNKTGENVGVYLRTLEDDHFLNFVPGESMELILRQEPGIQYVYSYLACGGQLISGYYYPLFRVPLELKCP